MREGRVISGNVPAQGERDINRIIRGIRDLFEGRSNAFGSFTVTQSAGTTTVTHPNIGSESKIFLQARHANAAAEVGNGTIYVSSITITQFIVTHANSATANRNFDFAIVG